LFAPRLDAQDRASVAAVKQIIDAAPGVSPVRWQSS
jgi:hypothetical protein